MKDNWAYKMMCRMIDCAKTSELEKWADEPEANYNRYKVLMKSALKMHVEYPRTVQLPSYDMFCRAVHDGLDLRVWDEGLRSWDGR